MADFTMLLDHSGRILELSVNSEDLAGAVDDSWIGRDLRDLATAESRARLEELLNRVSANPGSVASCDAGHGVVDDGDLLVRYRAVARGDDAEILLLGQDLRPEANLRQQLMNAQQALEQDYWRLRQIETRYRRLFDMVSDAIIVVDGDSLRVIESNPRAAALLAPELDSIAGKAFPIGLDKTGQRSVKSLLDEARASGRGHVEDINTAEGDHSFDVYATFLRQGNEARFLVRIAEHGSEASNGPAPGADQLLGASLQASPDAIVVTDDDGRIVAANQTFLELAQVVSQDQVLGQLADRWIGRSGVDLSVLLTNLRKNNSVKLFSTTLQGEQGSSADVEVSAVALNNPRGRNLAFFIRDVGRRVVTEHPSAAQLPRSIEQITKRVGRVPLKDLVRESTDVIEALCIEAALALTHDNRASAAELLGLSRQSLYAKLRRYEIDGPSEEGE
ncbi:MAG: transcriptional regulator PpsR [Halieaceae bacterium]|jgi:transcriptional regulator PpsR|nr:transcriptional regulator PpsR [Halieaceae bacterium]